MPTDQAPETPVKRGLHGLRLRPRGIAVIAILLGLLLLGGSAVVLNAFDGDVPAVAGDGDDEADVAAPAEEQQEAAPNEFTHPENYLGEDIRISGTVSEVPDPNTFWVANDNGDTLLVVYNGLPTLERNRLVMVQGKVFEYDQEQIDEELGAQLPEAVYGYGVDYALVASSVQDLGWAKQSLAQALNKDQDKAATETDAPATAASTSAGAPVTSAPASAPAPPPATTTDDSSGTSSGSGSGGSGGSGSGGGGNGGNTGGGSGGGGGGNEPPAGEPAAVAYTGNQTDGEYSDEATFEATVKDSDGARIEGARVVFQLKADGNVVQEFPATTDNRGVAETTVELTQTPRSYRLVARATKLGGKDGTKFIIERDESDLELDAEYDGNGNGNGNGNERPTTLVATLIDLDEGTALAGRTVTFYADGEAIGTAMTDDSGTARFEVPSEYRDKQTDFSAIFDGDDYYFTAGDGV